MVILITILIIILHRVLRLLLNFNRLIKCSLIFVTKNLSSRPPIILIRLTLSLRGVWLLLSNLEHRFLLICFDFTGLNIGVRSRFLARINVFVNILANTSWVILIFKIVSWAIS